MPRPSPRLGLDIDLTAPAEPAVRPPEDGNSVDFDLFEPEPEPERDSGAGRPATPGKPESA